VRSLIALLIYLDCLSEIRQSGWFDILLKQHLGLISASSAIRLSHMDRNVLLSDSIDLKMFPRLLRSLDSSINRRECHCVDGIVSLSLFRTFS
jgi:hypothetical protein